MKWLTMLIILLGGIAVLLSYFYGFRTHPDAAEVLWGGVPPSIQPFYTVVMFLAAAGYFAFTYFILFRLNPKDTKVYNRFGFGVFNLLYAAILIPSALWLPLTFIAIEYADPGLLWIVRLVLVVVGLASLGLLLSLLNTEPRKPLWAYRLAIVGSVVFCIQTAILDAIIWGSFFRV